MVLAARPFPTLPPLDANGATAYIQDLSAGTGQDRLGGTVATRVPGYAGTAAMAAFIARRPPARPAAEELT